jgi:hypothetical protein
MCDLARINPVAEASPWPFAMANGPADLGVAISRILLCKLAAECRHRFVLCPLDERIDAFRQALEASKKDFTIYIYKGANHAFNNDTSATRYINRRQISPGRVASRS